MSHNVMANYCRKGRGKGDGCQTNGGSKLHMCTGTCNVQGHVDAANFPILGSPVESLIGGAESRAAARQQAARCHILRSKQSERAATERRILRSTCSMDRHGNTEASGEGEMEGGRVDDESGDQHDNHRHHKRGRSRSRSRSRSPRDKKGTRDRRRTRSRSSSSSSSSASSDSSGLSSSSSRSRSRDKHGKKKKKKKRHRSKSRKRERERHRGHHHKRRKKSGNKSHRSDSYNRKGKKRSKQDHKHRRKDKSKRADDDNSSFSGDDDPNTRRSAISGKKIKMHIDKDDDDLVREKARKELLRFMNSST